METQLFHRDVYAPPSLFVSDRLVRLQYGPHALGAAENDKLGDLREHLPLYLDLSDPTLTTVEVEATGSDDRLTEVKRVVRYPLSEHRALVLAVSADGFVRSVWSNHAQDRHRTLNRHRYVQPRRGGVQ